MPKKHPADLEADRIMQIQNESEQKHRHASRLLIVLCALLLTGFGLAIYILPHNGFSETENRTLQTLPTFSVERLVDGRFTRDVADFYADQFPLRDGFVALKAGSELGLLKGENNDTLLGRDGYLIKRLEYDDYTKVYDNLRAVTAFEEKSGLAATVVVAPRAIDVLEAYLPPLYATDRADAVWEHVKSAYPDALTLTDTLRERANAGEPVWYRTDHHWTTLGAYYAYAELADTLGYEAYPLSYFTEETVTEAFYGTTYSAGGMRGVTPDAITLFRYEGDETITTEFVGEDRSLNGFYDRAYLEKKDKYSTFLADNHAHVRITGEGERRRLLLIKDSYANCLVPFLALHYDLEILDLRYYKGSTAALAAENGIDRVLILCNVDTLATSQMLTNLVYGLK